MKFLCEHCGELNEAVRVDLQSNVILLTCGVCGEVSRLKPESSPPAEAQPPSSDAPSPPTPATEVEPSSSKLPLESELPPVRCPKCFHRQVREDFCMRCGLDLHWAAGRDIDWEPIPEEKQQTAENARHLWSEVKNNPDSDALHESFVDYCTRQGLLDLALRRYREHLADFPRDPSFLRYQQLAANRLETIALAMMESNRWAPDLARRVHRVRRIILGIAIILFLLGLVLAVLLFKKHQASLPSAI